MRRACHDTSEGVYRVRPVNILDPILISQSPEVKNLRHLVKLQRFAREFNDALEIKQHGWNSDISKSDVYSRLVFQQALTGKFIYFIIIIF